MVAVCVPEDDGDRVAFDSISAEIARSAEATEPHSPDLSVAVQQAFSILYASPRGVSRRLLLGLLSPLGEPAELDAVLDHLVAEGRIEPGNGGRLVASTWLMDLGERGRIHSNIADARSVKVIDSVTGRAIGEVALTGGEGIVTLGGRTWRILGPGRGGLRVVPAGEAAGEAARFARRGGSGAFHRYLPEVLR
jgi:ATP-dependent Lhr-like helicase